MGSVRAHVEEGLARYDAREAVLRAFAWLDRDRARRLADASDRSGSGPLRGVTVGLKDIIDTAGIPTECGSRLFTGRIPTSDAKLVTNLRAAGALDLGKTITAELAFLTPGPTTNPYDPTRTPGGSSMGSAAAVAAEIVDAAVGSQTNGSIIRPATFCGVVGFKPTKDRISREGVFEFSETLDHVGGFARSVEDVARLCAGLAGEPAGAWWAGPLAGTPRIAAVRTREWEHATDDMRRHFQADVDRVAAAGVVVEWPELPNGLENAPAVLGTIMRVEGARNVGPLADEHPDRVSERARRFFTEGHAIDRDDYTRALAERARLIAAFTDWADEFDAILTPPAVGEAPGLETTGDPRFCTRWTLLGTPAITIPTGMGPRGLPLGLQIVGVPGQDRRLASAAAWVESVLVAPA